MITNQYINKRLVIAEIDNLIDKGKYNEEYDCAYRDGNNNALYALKEKINTLEVKEVNLEKEIDKFYGIYRKDGKTYSIEDNEECFDWKEDCNPDFEIAFAKHFFELGMAAFDTVKHS